jgi:hypothetical protein
LETRGSGCALCGWKNYTCQATSSRNLIAEKVHLGGNSLMSLTAAKTGEGRIIFGERIVDLDNNYQ